jgi:hypothetical protein
MGLGLPAQQGTRIDARSMGLVAELDAAEIPFRPLLAGLWSTKALAGADGGGGGSSWPSIRSSEAWDAQACSRVPSTEKCSSLSSGLISGAPISFSRKHPITCSLSSRSRF